MNNKIVMQTPFGEFSTVSKDAKFLVLSKSYGGSPIKAWWLTSQQAVQARVLDLRQRRQRVLGCFNIETSRLDAPRTAPVFDTPDEPTAE